MKMKDYDLEKINPQIASKSILIAKGIMPEPYEGCKKEIVKNLKTICMSRLWKQEKVNPYLSIRVDSSEKSGCGVEIYKFFLVEGNSLLYIGDYFEGDRCNSRTGFTVYRGL